MKIKRRGDSVAVEEWVTEFDSAFARIAGRFWRVEPRRQARKFLLSVVRCGQSYLSAADRAGRRRDAASDATAAR
jgi:hypothetical protein